MSRRYAIYYAPPAPDFAARAASWLGYDAQGQKVDFASVAGDGWRGRVKPAQKYGFHGTLKAPFRLKDGADVLRLQTRLSEFAAAEPKLTLGALEVRQVQHFIALVPRGNLFALNALAFRIVQDFDIFRAPLSAEDRARRKPERLSPPQRALFEEWGYPAVGDEFKFHLTLTGHLDEGTLAEMEDLAQRYFEQDFAVPFLVEDLCLFEERDDGQFQLLSRHPLKG